jgi:hypothetical protein
MFDQILAGNNDGDPVVQGVLDGLVVLLRDHIPTQQFAGLCCDVPEKDNFLERYRRETESRESRPSIRSFTTIEDLLRFLSRGV